MTVAVRVKPVPVMVTEVPPEVGPPAGLREATLGIVSAVVVVVVPVVVVVLVVVVVTDGAVAALALDEPLFGVGVPSTVAVFEVAVQLSSV